MYASPKYASFFNPMVPDTVHTKQSFVDVASRVVAAGNIEHMAVLHDHTLGALVRSDLAAPHRFQNP